MRSASRRAVSLAARRRASRRLGTCTNLPTARSFSRASDVEDDDDGRGESRAVSDDADRRVGVPAGVPSGVPLSGVCSCRSPSGDCRVGVDNVSKARRPDDGRERGDKSRACDDSGDPPALVVVPAASKSGEGRRPRGRIGDALGGGVEGEGLVLVAKGEPMVTPADGHRPGVHTPSLNALSSSSSHRLQSDMRHTKQIVSVRIQLWEQHRVWAV